MAYLASINPSSSTHSEDESDSLQSYSDDNISSQKVDPKQNDSCAFTEEPTTSQSAELNAEQNKKNEDTSTAGCSSKMRRLNGDELKDDNPRELLNKLSECFNNMKEEMKVKDNEIIRLKGELDEMKNKSMCLNCEKNLDKPSFCCSNCLQ